jgi:hypothetical protein
MLPARTFAVGCQTPTMDDVVAVRVGLRNGGERFFLTWGRIQDRVDPRPVAELVLKHSRGFSLGDEPVTAVVCKTLREAASSDSAPYFYECLLAFASSPIPEGDAYDRWREERAEAMRLGREISFCGRPQASLTCPAYERDLRPGWARADTAKREGRRN